MGNRNDIQLFEDQPIRAAWDAEKEEWYFSIVDVVRVLTDQPDARHASTYWAVMKNRLKAEGAEELLTNCKQFIGSRVSRSQSIIYDLNRQLLHNSTNNQCLS